MCRAQSHLTGFFYALVLAKFQGCIKNGETITTQGWQAFEQKVEDCILKYGRERRLVLYNAVRSRDKALGKLKISWTTPEDHHAQCRKCVRAAPKRVVSDCVLTNVTLPPTLKPIPPPSAAPPSTQGACSVAVGGWCPVDVSENLGLGCSVRSCLMLGRGGYDEYPFCGTN